MLCCEGSFRLSRRVTGCCAKYASVDELPSMIRRGCLEDVSTDVDIISSREYSCRSSGLLYTEGPSVATMIEKARWCQFR